MFEELSYEEYDKMRDSFDKLIPGEIWTPVIDSDFYEVSDLGRFRACREIIYSNSSRWAKKGDIKHRYHDIVPQRKEEYIAVCLYDPTKRSVENKYAYIQSHILVSLSFLGYNDGLYTDHINGNKHDNRLCNLQRLTPSENTRKSYVNDESCRWTNRKSAVIRGDGKYYKHLQYAADDVGVVSETIISAILTGGSSGGYTWKYADIEKQSKIDNKRKPKRYDTMKRRTNLGYYVRCVELDAIKTGAEWGRYFGCVSDTIYRAIDLCEGYSKYLDKHFELVDSL